MVTTETDRSHAQVFAAERIKREEIVPRVAGLKRTLRHLWLVRATEPQDVFAQQATDDLDTLKTYKIYQYPGFSDDVQEKLKTPYEKTKNPRQFRIYTNDRSVDLPQSADSFTISNRKGNTRHVPNFKTSVRKKIASDFPLKRLGTLRESYHEAILEEKNKNQIFDLLDEVVEDDVEIYTQTLEAYSSIDSTLLDFLSEAVERIKKIPPFQREGFMNDFSHALVRILKRDDDSETVRHQDPEVYYGRDSRWLFLARKAQQIGLDQRNTLRYLVASRTILESDIFRDYVLRHDIPFDAYHIDINAITATGVRKVLEILSDQKGEILWEEDVIRRGKFVATALPRRQRLFPEKNNVQLSNYIINRIELEMPGTSPHVFKIYNNGVIEPQFTSHFGTYRYIDELRAWAMEQAVVRHFLPKKT